MDYASPTEPANRKRSINLTIREDLIQDAKEFRINASKAAESGIRQVVIEAKREHWREENKEAILAYNAEIASRGIAIRPIWQEADE